MKEAPPKRSIGQTLVAILVLVVAAWVLLHFLAGIAIAIVTVAVIVAAVIAVIWALRVLL